jgi:ribonuclease P protein component
VKRIVRLTRSQDFMRVRRFGKSYAHPLLVLVVASGDQDNPRIGLITGKSLGNAVTRNRARRRLRAAVSTLAEKLTGSWDAVLIARRPILKAKFLDIPSALFALFTKAGLVDDDPGA